MLWGHYVFRKDNEVHELWEQIHSKRELNILYISGHGFDLRAQKVLAEYVTALQSNKYNIKKAKLLLIDFTGYDLDKGLIEITNENTAALTEIFSSIGRVETVAFGSRPAIASYEEEDLGATIALRSGVQQVLGLLGEQTDIVLDVSSLPRVVYLALLTSILAKLVPNKDAELDSPHPLVANGVNFQVLVAEDAELDGRIKAEDPSSDLVQIPGFYGGFHPEFIKDWPVVWFPVLGENRVNQLEKVLSSPEISPDAEICPVVPHPSKNPRRADDLLIEYQKPLFNSRKTSTSNIVYVHEANPFEAYRQLLGAMKRFQHSMNLLGNCRLLVTPLGSKLVTIGAGLACFEMRPTTSTNPYKVALPLAEPKRYIADETDLRNTTPSISALLLTGDAFSQ